MAENTPDLRPSMAVPLPDFPEVSVALDVPARHDEKTGLELIRFCYYGWPEALITAGILTEELLEPTRKHRRDAEGRPVSIDRYWRLRDGQPQKYCKVRRSVVIQSIDRLPGTQAAIEAAQRCREWQDKWRADLDEELRRRQEDRQDRSQPSMQRSFLRLVVDNTRGGEDAHG